MWLKYRYKWAHGFDVDFSWKDIERSFSLNRTADGKIDENCEYLKEILSDIKEEYNWSEHYRGLDYEIVELPPKEILDKYIIQLEKSIRMDQQYLNDLKKIRNLAP